MKNPMNALKQLFTKTITSVVNTFKKLLFKEVETVARKEGTSQTSDKITAKHASIVWIISRCSAFLQSTANTILEDIEKAFSNYQQISNDFFKNSSLQDLRLQKEQLLEELQHKLTQITVHINTQKEAIEQQIVELTTLLKHDRIDIKNYTKIDVRWKLFIAGVLIVGIVFAETFSNLQSFLAIPNEPFVRALLFAVGISFGTYTMGAWFVKILQNQLNSRLEKNLKAIAVMSIVLLAYLGISFYRQDAMQIVHTSDDGRAGLQISTFTFLVINSLLFFGLIAIKLVIYPDPETLLNNKNHRALKKEIKIKEGKIKQFRVVLEKLEKRKKHEREHLKKQYEDAIEKKDKQVATYYNALKEQQTLYNKKLAFGNCFYKEMNSVTKEAIGFLVQQIGLYQGNLSQLNVAVDEITLENPFKQYTPIYDNEIESMFNPIKPRNYEKSHPFTFHNN